MTPFSFFVHYKANGRGHSSHERGHSFSRTTDNLKEMDEANPGIAQTDVALVIGANDVVNPLVRTDPKSRIAGMPILDVEKARTVVVVKRSLRARGLHGYPTRCSPPTIP